MYSVVEPNAWVALRLPSEMVKVMQIKPDTTISLGKYGAFPSNLIIHRPYHLTYELLDREEDEKLSRLRVVPTSELYADIFADEAAAEAARNGEAPADDSDRIFSATDGVEYSIVDTDTNAVVAKTHGESIDARARQRMTGEEIEELKRQGADAGKDLIAKLILSHTAINEKTSYSLAKYKILKMKRYIRRFSVSPLDPLTLGTFLLEEKDVGSRILDMREEMIALLGCWGNVHFGGDSVYHDALSTDTELPENPAELLPLSLEQKQGRWLVVDDSGGLLIAAMAERMGILYPYDEEDNATSAQANQEDTQPQEAQSAHATSSTTATGSARPPPKRVHNHDFHIPFSRNNTITTLTSNSQPNLTYLRYFGFDSADPNHPPHPLSTHLMTLSWLQLIDPTSDLTYTAAPEDMDAATLSSWKPSRRGTYHRKRRRWARTRHVIDTARAGNFDGLVVATQMDPISVLRHTLPLLAGGAPIAVYSPSVEYLSKLADCFSIARRAEWAGVSAPAEIAGKTARELEYWQGSEDFPLNPTLVVAPSVQTSRARKWQVLPGRTHPVMSSRGGADGFVFTAWRAVPAEGRVEARGRFKKRKIAEEV